MWLQAEECGWYTEGSKELDKLRQNNQICILERLIRQQCGGGQNWTGFKGIQKAIKLVKSLLQ